MSTTITGDLPATRQAPPANGIGTQRKKRKQRAKRAAKATATTQTPSTTTRAAPKKAAPKKAAGQIARTTPIGIASAGNATDLMTGFIQSMPKAGTVLAAQSRDACKATFAALIDWIYPATKAA